jgi:hypothetical protein
LKAAALSVSQQKNNESQHTMKNSQYLNNYLSGNASRGESNGLTIGSFLAYVLRGKAKKYSGHYVRALQNSCVRVGAKQGSSVRGGIAYYPAA